MTDTQRVTDDLLQTICGEIESDGPDTERNELDDAFLDLRDSRALAQSQAATIAELRAEVERWKDTAQKLFAEYNAMIDTKEAAESALATATARIEKLEAALREIYHHPIPAAEHPELLPLHGIALAALQEDKPHV